MIAHTSFSACAYTVKCKNQAAIKKIKIKNKKMLGTPGAEHDCVLASFPGLPRFLLFALRSV